MNPRDELTQELDERYTGNEQVPMDPLTRAKAREVGIEYPFNALHNPWGHA